MKYGIVGNKKMPMLPKWLEYFRNLIFVFVVFVITFAAIWVFYVILQVSHL